MIAQLDNEYIQTRPVAVIRRLLSYSLFEGRPLTTKGRWINPFIFTHFWLEKRLPQLKQVEKPIFIIGTGRSGTTILGVILSIHRDIGFLNEPKALWHAIYSKEDVIGNYDVGSGLYRLGTEDVTNEVKQAAHRLFSAYLTATFSKRLVDKYPELIFRVPFVRAIFPDAKFIFLVRNGWDTCCSIENWSKRKEVQVNSDVHNWWGVNSYKWKLIVNQLIAYDPIFSEIISVISELDTHSDMAAIEWIVTMKEGLYQTEKNSECIHMLRYEDLVENPREVLSKLLVFCELPFDNKLFSYAQRILTPTSIYSPFTLHPAIQPIFNKTMKSLGYYEFC